MRQWQNTWSSFAFVLLCSSGLAVGCGSDGNDDGSKGSSDASKGGSDEADADGEDSAEDEGDTVAGDDEQSGDDATESSTGEGSSASEVGSTPDVCDEPSPGESPLRRLTNTEYRNTLVDLVGDEELVESVTGNLPREPTSLGFRTSASALTITPLIADVYTQAAQELGLAVAASAESVGCDPDEASAGCVQSFIESFGKRAYRRPLSNRELGRYADLYETLLDETQSPRTTLAWLTSTMLSSPNFLFRVELSSAPGGGVSRPTDHEMATRLSYLLWQTMPDQALFDAADAGELTTREGIDAQVVRMLQDPKAYRVYDFFEQWLDLDEAEDLTRSDETYPEFDDEMRELFKGENRRFILHLFTKDEPGTFAELLSADYTFANRRLAEHYGLDDVPNTAELVQVDAPGRAGVLTQATMLIHDRPLRTSIVKRGLKIRTDFLCQIVPAPPDNVDTTLPDLDGDLTQRQRLEQHRSEPACAGCHNLMDPIGEVFETFDALGRQRTEDEGGADIVPGGTVTATRTLDGEYDSPAALAAAMATSDEVRECFTLQAFRYFYGRDATDADECTQAQLMQTFARNDYRLIDLLFGLTRSDQFLYRAPSNNEGDAQ
jgi:hypothetical protein